MVRVRWLELGWLGLGSQVGSNDTNSYDIALVIMR